MAENLGEDKAVLAAASPTLFPQPEPLEKQPGRVTDQETQQDADRIAVEQQPGGGQPAKAKPVNWPVRVGKFVLSQWLVLGIGLACGLAYRFPNVAKTGGTIRAEYSLLYGAVALIFLLSGLSIPHDKLQVHLRNWRLHLAVQGISFLVAPALMVAVVHAIVAGSSAAAIDRAVLAGYVLTGCLPTTISSNVVMTRAAGGDEAAALVEVLVANVLGPFITPGWTVALLPRNVPEMAPFRGQGHLGSMYADVFERLGLSMLLPLAVGLALRWIWPAQVVRVLAKTQVNKLSTLCLLLIIWSTFSTCFATGALSNISSSTVAFVVLYNVAFYLVLTVISFYVSRIPHHPFSRANNSERPRISSGFEPTQLIAICFCGPAKTTGLGLPLLFAMWSRIDVLDRSKASVPVLLYTTEQIFVAHYVVHFFRGWLKKKEDAESESEATLATRLV